MLRKLKNIHLGKPTLISKKNCFLIRLHSSTFVYTRQHLSRLVIYFHVSIDFSTKKEISRSSRPEVSCKKGVLRNFPKFTGKHLSQSLFFNKVAGLKPATLLKKRLWHRCFPMKFVKFFRTPFLQNIFGRLLLELEFES